MLAARAFKCPTVDSRPTRLNARKAHRGLPALRAEPTIALRRIGTSVLNVGHGKSRCCSGGSITGLSATGAWHRAEPVMRQSATAWASDTEQN